MQTPQKRARIKYEREKRIKKNISLHRERDADLIEYINRLPNFSKLVKHMIRKMMANNE